MKFKTAVLFPDFESTETFFNTSQFSAYYYDTTENLYPCQIVRSNLGSHFNLWFKIDMEHQEEKIDDFDLMTITSIKQFISMNNKEIFLSFMEYLFGHDCLILNQDFIFELTQEYFAPHIASMKELMIEILDHALELNYSYLNDELHYWYPTPALKEWKFSVFGCVIEERIFLTWLNIILSSSLEKTMRMEFGYENTLCIYPLDKKIVIYRHDKGNLIQWKRSNALRYCMVSKN
jgi:hypothetical protein